MTVAYNNSFVVHNNGEGETSTTLPVIIPSGLTNRFIQLYYVHGNNAYPSGATCNGNAMELSGRIAYSNTISISVYHYINPAEGSYNIVVSGKVGGAAAIAIAYLYTGVHQTTPLGTAGTNSGNGTSQSDAVPSVSGDLCVNAVGRLYANGVITAGAGQENIIQDASVGTDQYMARGFVSTLVANDASTEMSSSWATTRNWVSIGFAIKPALGSSVSSSMSSSPSASISSSPSISASISASPSISSSVSTSISSSPSISSSVSSSKSASVSSSLSASPSISSSVSASPSISSSISSSLSSSSSASISSSVSSSISASPSISSSPSSSPSAGSVSSSVSSSPSSSQSSSLSASPSISSSLSSSQSASLSASPSISSSVSSSLSTSTSASISASPSASISSSVSASPSISSSKSASVSASPSISASISASVSSSPSASPSAAPVTGLTPTELETLRNDHPHVGKFYLSFLKPSVVYCGTLTGSYSRGDRVLTLSDVSGDLSDCVAGNTIYIGTACGDYSISRRRFRLTAGSTITVDENSVIWAAGQYVTVVDDHELFPIYPFITDVSPYTFYKDYDIAYSDQNSYPPPVAIAGFPKVGFLGAGIKTFTLDASGSYAIASGATISTYLWECADGTIASPTSEVTTITFTTAGQRWLKLTVTDSNAKSQSTYRRVYVHERTGANAPCIDFELIGNPSGSYDSGGWDMKVKLYAGAELSNIPDNTQVVLWYESYYKGTEEYIGDNGNIRFVGYITSENISNIMSSGYVEFDVSTVNRILDSSNMFSISLEENTTVDTWYRFPTGTLTVARSIHHLWKWHSTLLDMCDVFLPVSNTNTMPACDDMENGTLWTLTEWAYANGIFARGCCDKTGRLHFQEDILMIDTSSQAAVVEVMEILQEDLKGEITSQYIRNSDFTASSVVCSGVAMIAGVATPLISKAPGNSPENKGQDTYVVERLCVASQAELDMICGRLLSQLNREVQELRLSFAGNYPVDIVPQKWFETSLVIDKRGNTLTEIKLVCRSVTDVINMAAGTVNPECIFELLFMSVDGIADTYPETILPPNTPVPPYTYPTYTPLPPIVIPTAMNFFGLTVPVGNGTAVIVPGVAYETEVPFECIIDSVKLISNAALVGSIVLDFWKCSFAQIPTTAISSITASAKPTLSSQYKSSDIILTGWNRIWHKGDIITINVDIVSTVKLVFVMITGRKS
jgi:hypothetical protein